MDPNDNLSYLLYHTANIMYRQCDQVLQERLGIGMSQFKILMILQQHASIQQRVLADCLGQTEASVSRQIKIMVDKGMLVVKVNPESRREHVTQPTTKGIKVATAAQEILREYNAPALEQLKGKQREQFAEMLRLVHGFYCSSGKPFAINHQQFNTKN
ncbi:MAG TPA: MarR family winged helix-turn-helix transcriptional regulator [Candidatus Saccharimonadales bacterium]